MENREVRVCMRMFLRTYLVGGCINARGMQNIGLSYIMEPGLSSLYTGDGLQKARKRYLKTFNSHPCWTPLLAGLFLSVEKKILKGLLPPKVFPQMKETIACSLSAVGDSLFGGSLYVFWSLSTMILLALGFHGLACMWAVAWIALFEGFKLYTFWQGIRHGVLFLTRLKSWNLMGWAGRIKVINACLLVLFWFIIWPGEAGPVGWLAGTGAILLLAWMVSFSYRVREVFILVLVALLMSIPWLLPKMEPYLQQFLAMGWLHPL